MTTLQTETTTKRVPMEWSDQLRVKFKSNVSHAYIITGNVRDIADNRLTLNTYLSRLFTTPPKAGGPANFDLVIFYDRANGIRFPTPEMEKIFLNSCKWSEQTAPAQAMSPDVQAVFGPGGVADNGSKPLPKDPTKALELIERVLRDDRRDEDNIERRLHTVLILDYAESLLPAGTWGTLSPEDRSSIIKLLSWAKDPELAVANNPIFVIAESPSNLHDSLIASSSRFEQLEILLPTTEERLAFIESLEQKSIAAKKGPLPFEDGYDKVRFANQTAGLRKMAIEEIKMTAGYMLKDIGPDIVRAQKRKIIDSEYEAVLEMVDPEVGFDAVGGHDHLKTFLMRDVVAPMLSGDTGRVPMGIVLAGPSGTGKTILAEALAFESRLNMIKLDIGKLLGSLVGQSEAAARRAFLAVRSQAPVLVFLDEADQAVSRGNHGDSGVSNRIFKMLLELMSDTRNRGKVFFILATNRVDNIDPALKRPGRVDKIIPVLPPETAERSKIFPAVMHRYGYKVDGAPINFSELAIATEGWVGSDIESAMVKAYSIACRDNRKSIREADIKAAIDTVIPATASVRHWSNLALLECNDIELLPPTLRKNFKKEREKRLAEVERAKNKGMFVDVPRQSREDLI